MSEAKKPLAEERVPHLVKISGPRSEISVNLAPFGVLKWRKGFEHGLTRDLGQKRKVPAELLEQAGAYLHRAGVRVDAWSSAAESILGETLDWSKVPADRWSELVGWIERMTPSASKSLALNAAQARELAASGFTVEGVFILKKPKPKPTDLPGGRLRAAPGFPAPEAPTTDSSNSAESQEGEAA